MLEMKLCKVFAIGYNCSNIVYKGAGIRVHYIKLNNKE